MMESNASNRKYNHLEKALDTSAKKRLNKIKQENTKKAMDLSVLVL